MGHHRGPRSAQTPRASTHVPLLTEWIFWPSLAGAGEVPDGQPEQPFVAVRAEVAGRAWLAIFSLDGIMETAFPPRNIDRYLARPGFTRIGTVEEVLG